MFIASQRVQFDIFLKHEASLMSSKVNCSSASCMCAHTSVDCVCVVVSVCVSLQCSDVQTGSGIRMQDLLDPNYQLCSQTKHQSPVHMCVCVLLLCVISVKIAFYHPLFLSGTCKANVCVRSPSTALTCLRQAAAAA